MKEPMRGPLFTILVYSGAYAAGGLIVCTAGAALGVWAADAVGSGAPWYVWIAMLLCSAQLLLMAVLLGHGMDKVVENLVDAHNERLEDWAQIEANMADVRRLLDQNDAESGQDDDDEGDD